MTSVMLLKELIRITKLRTVFFSFEENSTFSRSIIALYIDSPVIPALSSSFSTVLAPMPLFGTFIILLRIGLSGFTMCKYLKYKFKNQSNLRYIIFSISYALMAYNVCYFFNYMYFDTVVLFPKLSLNSILIL